MALRQPGTLQEGDRAAGARNLPGAKIIGAEVEVPDIVYIRKSFQCPDKSPVPAVSRRTIGEVF